jgi:hypothetical protein
MALKEVTYYQIECDYEGCGEATDTQMTSDYSAFSDHGSAHDEWIACGHYAGEDGSHYCAEHSPSPCVDDECSEDCAACASGDLELMCGDCISYAMQDVEVNP